MAAKFKFPKHSISRIAFIDEDRYPEIANELLKYFDYHCDIHGNQSMTIDSESIFSYIEESEAKNIFSTKEILQPVLNAMERQNIDQLHIYKG